MATSLTEPGSTEVESLHFSFPISKMETDADGDLIVKGVATDGSVDSDYQIVDPEWSAKALGDWLSTGGNVRMAHDAHRPVGKGLSVEIDRDGDGKHWVKSVIVDSEAKRLVEKGVLRAYSVGISHPVIKRDPTGRARGGIICGGELSELSIVDRPANKNSYLELAKAAGANGSIEFTGVLHEGAPEDVVKKAVGTFSPGDLAKLLEHRRVAEKRDMDPDVGGGVDRDKIPASDFVDPKGRRFPIVTSGDVSDAVSSYGRAKPQIPMDKFKSRLTSIARRKGFESSLPESWGNGDAKKGALMAQPPMGSAQAPQPQPPQHSGPPVPAQGHPAPPAGPQTHPATLAPSPPHGGPQDGTAPHPQPQMQDPNQPPAFKCDCPCGYEADSHMNFCPGCGSPIDKGGMGMGGQPQPPAGGQPPADPTDANGHMQVTMPMQQKADAPPSKTVGEPLERTDVPESVADAKKKPKKQGKPKSLMAETEAYAKKPKKNGKIPTPKGVPTPDGLPATKSSVEMDYAMQTAMVLKQLDVPSDLGALHDLLCPGFHPIDAEKCHPTHSLKSVDVSFWQNEALNAATGAPLVEAARATERWQAAETIKSAAADRPDEILDIRHEAHKAFKDAQIGPGTAPTPTQIRAGQFKRPNLTAGHGRPSNGHDSPNTAEVPSDGIAAADFRGGYLDSQHADESPSNKSQRPINYPTSTGNLQTVDYANASRQAAKSAMDAIHDHISHTFPDLCPMGSPGGTEDLGHVPMGETKVPQPVGDRAKKSEGTGTEKSVTTEPAGSDVLEMLGGMAAELRTLTKSLNKERKRNAELQKTVDSMAAMPDPTVTAFKGVFFDRTVNKSAVPARAVADAAEQTQQMMMRELESQFRTSHDPAQREAAWASLMKMRGLS